MCSFQGQQVCPRHMRAESARSCKNTTTFCRSWWTGLRRSRRMHSCSSSNHHHHSNRSSSCSKCPAWGGRTRRHLLGLRLLLLTLLMDPSKASKVLIMQFILLACLQAACDHPAQPVLHVRTCAYAQVCFSPNTVVQGLTEPDE